MGGGRPSFKNLPSNGSEKKLSKVSFEGMFKAIKLESPELLIMTGTGILQSSHVDKPLARTAFAKSTSSELCDTEE